MKLQFDEIVEHQVQLLKVELIRVNCQCNGKEISDKQSNLDIRVNVSGEIIDDKSGYSLINVIVDCNEEGFQFDITERGLFVANNDISLKKEDLEKFLAIQGVRILWSYVREALFDLSCRMIRKPLMLPTLDVAKTLSMAKEKEN